MDVTLYQGDGKIQMLINYVCVCCDSVRIKIKNVHVLILIAAFHLYLIISPYKTLRAERYKHKMSEDLLW